MLPYLQPAALTPHLRELARKHEVALTKLRASAAEATGTEQPEIAPLRRIRPRDVVTMAALIFSAYLLITKLAAIGFGTIANQLSRATVAWVIVALLLAQATFMPGGISVRGGVATPLPLLPCVALQSAIKFVNLTVPSSAGRIGLNLRVLQRMGAPRAEALVGGAVDDASNKIARISLLFLTLPLVRASVHTSRFKVAGPERRLLISIGVALAIGAVIALAVPKVRVRVLSGGRSALSAFWTIMRTRRKRVEVFGGTVVAGQLYALALGASSLAYGEFLNIWQLTFVVASSSLVSSAIPGYPDQHHGPRRCRPGVSVRREQ